LDEEDEEEDDEEEEEDEEEEDQATDIKSNNPHLAGGEKSSSNPIPIRSHAVCAYTPTNPR